MEIEIEIKAIEAYINQECIDAIGRSVAKYGSKEGLIMAATEVPVNVLLLQGRLNRLRNVHLNDAYTESFKALREVLEHKIPKILSLFESILVYVAKEKNVFMIKSDASSNISKRAYKYNSTSKVQEMKGS